MSRNQHPRPAAMSDQCDSVYRNPNYTEDGSEPLLIRCHDPATVRMVISTPEDTYSIKRCNVCREVLHAQMKTGATFEILAEEAI